MNLYRWGDERCAETLRNVLLYSGGYTRWWGPGLYEDSYSAGPDGACLKNGNSEAVVKMLYSAARFHEETGLAVMIPTERFHTLCSLAMGN